MRARVLLLMMACAAAGILAGGYLFARSQPRSVIALTRCQRCLSPEDLGGLLASVGIQRARALMPFVVFESDRSVALRDPIAGHHLHFIIIPKKDIKDLGQMSADNAAWVVDAMYVARHLIEQNRLTKYRLYTNGPGYQTVTYLHWHLIAE